MHTLARTTPIPTPVQGRVRRRDVLPGMKEAGWRSCWTMLLMEPFQVSATSSRIIAILYGFLATVLINTCERRRRRLSGSGWNLGSGNRGSRMLPRRAWWLRTKVSVRPLLHPCPPSALQTAPTWQRR